MEIQIPSPSVFLRKSPVLASASTIPAKRPPLPKQKSSNPSKKASVKVQDGAVTKPKQSKSRNGCATCKKKRLKCDEKKPSCDQCKKRNVTCEGYIKDFKWRPFEETTFNPKPVPRRKPFRSSSFSVHDASEPLEIAGPSRPDRGHLPSHHNLAQHPAQTWSPGLHSAFASATHAFQDPTLAQPRPSPSSISPNHQQNLDLDESTTSDNFSPEPNFIPGYSPGDISPDFVFDSSLDAYGLVPPVNAHVSNPPPNDETSTRSYSSGSPQLIDLLLPGTDMNRPPDPSELRPPMSPLPYNPEPREDIMNDINMVEDYDEEIARTDFRSTISDMPNMDSGSGPSMANSRWHFRASSPALSDTSSTSSKTSDLTILAQPKLDISSPEMLMLRFDKQTCGILSIKDGPTENPWRTLIWPLARESPALYHAISSMTAFHGAHEVPHLQFPGMAHMTKSIKKLAFEIENMRLDSALATSLALAFSEGWDSHVSTGVQHLRGAKVMVNNAVVKHRSDMRHGRMNTQDATRLKFLCNTFVYMDVIARLTSLEESADLNFEEVLTTVNAPMGDQIEVDPLMGCATTLFPLIGRAANLIQRVRKSESNSLNIISQARELIQQLQEWEPLSARAFERPEDPHSEVQHSIQTAEAYRYAMLLYLHQAVPDIPSDPAHKLAKKVLVTLASVPVSSRATIVQIFPLFAASCEIASLEDRNWVAGRWEAMISRLKIGNVTACWKVVQEVWNRRDEYEAKKAERRMKRYSSRGMSGANFIPPDLNIPPSLKRKAQSAEVANGVDGLIFDAYRQTHGQGANMHDDVDALTGRVLKRRMTFDPMNVGINLASSNTQDELEMSMSMPLPGYSRRNPGDILNDKMDFEYTVRGRLHWLGTMADWRWEVFLG